MQVSIDRVADRIIRDELKQAVSPILDPQANSKWQSSDGAIATGIMRQATTSDFIGDAGAIYEALQSESCPAGRSIDQALMRNLAARTEQQTAATTE